MARKPADQLVNREDIIAAAADVLQRCGYEATTMKDIAAEVNLVAASLYHHFKNKDFLLLAVLEDGLKQVTRLLDPIVQSSQSNAEKLRRMIRVHIESLTENTAVGAAMIFEMRSLLRDNWSRKVGIQADNDLQREFSARRDAFFLQRDHFEGLFRQVIHDGITSGEFRPVDEAIFVKMMLGAHNWVALWYKPDGSLSGQAIAGMIADSFLRALTPSPMDTVGHGKQPPAAP